MTQERSQPNIVLLMTDQHRGDCLGAAGHPCVKTPHLDRIAGEGAMFRRGFSSTPSCTPARAGLLTGLSPWNHGMLGYNAVAEHYENEMPAMLRAAGYYGMGIGKMHWHPQRTLHGFHKTLLDESGRSESEGFVSDYRQWFQAEAPELNPDATGIGWNDHMMAPYALPEHLHPTRWTGDQAIEFLDGYEDDNPFFLKVSFARPHSPYDPPQRFLDMYADADIPERVIGDWAAQHALPEQENFPDHIWRGDLGAEKARLARMGYYANITFIDEQVGRVLASLEERGELDNTLIVMTADHGDMLGDHHLWRKTYAYEASARVPMLVRWADSMTDATRGQVLDQPVELRDILPTFLDAATGGYDEDRFDGRSLMEPINGETENWRELLDLEHSTCYWPDNQWTGVTDGRYKYVYYAPTGEQQLFDTQEDPDELRDLVRDPGSSALVAEWRGKMIAVLEERGEPYVVDGDLGLRPKAMVRGANYPKPE